MTQIPGVPIPVHPTPPVNPATGHTAPDLARFRTDLMRMIGAAVVDWEGVDVLALANQLLTYGWRPPAQVIRDPATADRLPAGTVVVSRAGQVAQRYDGMGGWWQVLDNDQYDSSTLIGTGWITVLHTPGGTDGQH